MIVFWLQSFSLPFPPFKCFHICLSTLLQIHALWDQLLLHEYISTCGNAQKMCLYFSLGLPNWTAHAINSNSIYCIHEQRV